MKYIVLTASLLILAGVFAGCSEQDTLTNTPAAGELVDQGQTTSAEKIRGNVGLPGRGSTLRLKGLGHGYEGTVPDIDGDGVDDPATCFDVDLFDSSGMKIGTAVDRLYGKQFRFKSNWRAAVDLFSNRNSLASVQGRRFRFLGFVLVPE